MYLGDLEHSSFRPGENVIQPGNVSGLQQLWKTTVGGRVASAVTVSGGFLYFGDWNGDFHALNALTGQVAWSRFIGKAPDPADASCMRGIGVSAQPLIVGDTVYAAGGDSAVYAMDRRTGELHWRVSLADPQQGNYLWSSLMLSQNALYLGIASLSDCPVVRGGIARIPLDNPQHPLTRYLIPENAVGAGIWSTPAIDEENGLVYVTTGNADGQFPEQGVWGSALLALDALTLEVKSYFFLPIVPEEDDADWGSSPLLFEAGGQQLIAANGKNGMMYVLSRPDLQLLWTYRLAIDCDSPGQGCGSISTPAFDGNLLVTGAGQPEGDSSPPGMVYAFDPVAGNLQWSYPAKSAVLAPVTLVPGLVFAPSTKGLAILDSSSGAELWNDGFRGGLFSQAVVSNGIVYTTYISGDVIAWAPQADNGQPSGLAVSQSGLQFRYTAGGPLPPSQSISIDSGGGPVTVAISSDSSWLTAGQSSAITPTQVSIQVSPSGMAPGDYTGNLVFTAPGSDPVSVRVTMSVNGPLPPVTQANVANAASFQPGTLAPGSLFTIFASNLTSGAAAAPPGFWPTTLNGVVVRINGIAVPLGYVSPIQINAQVPYEVAAGPATLTLESNGALTGPAALNIKPSSPGIFIDSAGRAAVLNQDGTVNSAGSGAPPGSVISVFFTGQGAVDFPVATGSAAPSATLSNTLAATTASIGGIPAEVTFSGLAPAFIGLAQANLRIPDLVSGDYQIVLHLGDVQSNTGTITVSNLQ